jgi:hypothetical protein
MRAILGVVAGLLERAEILDPDALVRGYVGDQVVTFEMKTKTSGSMTLKWTEARVPGGLSLLLSIRPSSPREERDKERGLAVDHELGNAPFDAAFIVEGAPERLVRELVDEEVQRGLLALRPDHVFSSEGALTIQMPDWVEDAERAALLVRTAARLGAVSAEIARRHAADVGRPDTSGYRGEVAEGVRARDDREIQALAGTMERRRAAQRTAAIRLAIFILIGLLCGGGALFLLAR